MKKMPISKYIEIIEPQYIYLRVIPLTSIRNYTTSSIISAAASTYLDIRNRVRLRDKKLFVTADTKIGFYIYLAKDKAEFYFILPKDILSLVKDKIQDCWKGITIKQVDSLPTIDGTRYCLTYQKEDALSLASDCRNNDLLSSLMGTIDIMEAGDEVGLLCNFSACSQKTWKGGYDRTIEKLKNGMPIERQKKSTLYVVKLLGAFLIKLSEFTLSSIASLADGGNSAKTALEPVVLEEETKKKRDSKVVKTQIIAFSSADDPHRERNNAVSIGESFKIISSDNELVYHRLNKTDTLVATKYTGADTMKMSVAECSNLVCLPGRKLLSSYCVEHVELLETEFPQALRSGNVCIGENTYRGNTQPAYLTTDKEYKHLALVVIGPTRAGKTELIANVTNDSVCAGECVIAFDFCGCCELSDKLQAKIKNTLVIDCEDFAHLQGLGYNEVNPNESDPFLRYRNAKMMSMQLITLINCVNDEDSKMSPKMDRYLESAALIGFISGGSINDVFQILQSYSVRHSFINQIPASQAKNLEEYALGLMELDEIDKAGHGSTKDNLIIGIIDRVNRLKQNTYLELMLKQGIENNINLVEEMQTAQLITLRMPETMFATEKEKDIYCTYWISKIWLALQIRKQKYKKLTSINIIVDELYQVPSCQDFIRSKLSQLAKFFAKMIISAHYLGQIKIIRSELKAANSSYIIISGSDKDNFAELKQELAPYAVEDLLGLARYHAINLLKYNDGYARFVTKLPKPI